MTIELSKLVFAVDTKQLSEAIDKHQRLVELNKQLSKSKVTTTTQGGINTETKQKIGLLDKLDNLYKDLAQGATRWEASQLRAARQMGVPLESVKEQLVGIRKLSQDPFDSAIGSVRSVTQYFDQLTNRISLANEGLLLTAKQMREFSRIPFEVEGQMRAGGKSPQNEDNAQYLQRIKEEERTYLNTAKAANELANAEKGRSDVLKQNATAQKFLSSEMQRVDAVLKEMNGTYGINASTQERSAAAVAKYSTALERSGIKGEEASKKLESYRKKTAQIADMDQKRAVERLSNSLAPQISDVAVSAAGGMPLYLIALQQGLQIRDLIGQSRVDASKLQETFSTAMSKMVTSIGTTVSALGQLAFGGLVSAGKAVLDFATKITFADTAIAAFSKRFPQIVGATTILGTAFSALIGGALALTAVAIGAVTYEYVKLISANNELVRSLAVSGGGFGVSYQQSSLYVESLTKVGATTRDAISIIGQMADSGKFAASQIQLVGKAAVDMERYGGVAIKDTIKAFEDMAKDPVKALTELAIRTGDVSPKVLQLAYDLKSQGKNAELAALGINALASQTTKAVDRMKESLHPLTQMWVDFKHAVSQAWTGFGNAINRAMGVNPITEQMQDQLKSLRSRRSDVESNLKTNAVFGIAGDSSLLKSLDQEINKLQEGLKFRRQSADAEVIIRELNSASAKDVEKNNENALEYMSKQAKAKKELTKLEEAYKLSQKLATPDKPSLITPESYAQKKKELEEQLVDKEARKASNKAQAYSLNIQEKLNDAYNQMVGKAKELSLLEKAILDIRDDPAYKMKSSAGKAEVEKEATRLLELAKKDVELAATRNFLEKQRKELQEDTIKGRKELAEFDRRESLHGAEYEKRIATLQDLNFRGIVPDEDLQTRLNAQLDFSNVKKSSDSSLNAANAQREKLGALRSDLEFETGLLGATERVREEAQIRRNLQKQWLDVEAEDRKAYEEINSKQEGVFQQLSLDEVARVSVEKKKFYQDEANFKLSLLTDDAQRQKQVNDLIKRGFESMGDALVDFAATGKSSFGDMIKQMLIDLAKLEVKMQLMRLYESTSSVGGSSGFVGGVLKLFSGASGTGVSAVGTALTNQYFAKGGAFTNGVVSSPTQFDIGTMGEKTPEAIIPLKRTRDGSLGVVASGEGKAVNVENVYNITIDSRSDQASIYAGVQSMLQQNNAKLVDQLQTGGHLV